MPTLILSPRHTEDSHRLWRAAVARGWDVERLPTWRVPESFLSAAEPILFIEALMAPFVADQFGLSLVEPPDDWLPNLPETYRLRTIRSSTLGAERSSPAAAFVKPPNDKSFAVGVYRGDELPAAFSDDTPVLVAEVVEWEREYRVFLLDREVRTLSIYLRSGALQRETGYFTPPDEADEVLRFVAGVLADRTVTIPRAVVMDVGVIRGRGWAVVELNAAWGAGLYGCDPAGVLDVLRATVHAGGAG